MFEGTNTKLEMAYYFLSNIKKLADDAGGIAYVRLGKRNEMGANLDGFFFELMSAKDFFLQGINDKYVKLAKEEATKINLLKSSLASAKYPNALKVVESIEKELSNRTSRLWKLNNYRNSATHRELMHFARVVTIPTTTGVKMYLFKDPEDPSQGYADIEVIPYCEQSLERMRKFLEKLYSDLNV